MLLVFIFQPIYNTESVELERLSNGGCGMTCTRINDAIPHTCNAG